MHYWFAALVIVSLSNSAIRMAWAENAAPPAPQSWRPKSGTYAVPGEDFVLRCGEYGDLAIELADNSVNGNELGCKVSKLRDIAPGVIRLALACYDLNLAESLNRPDKSFEDRIFQEVMFLKRVDESTVYFRKTLNGKFVTPGSQVAYCPEDAQRMYQEGKRRDSENKANDASENAKPPSR